MSKPEIPGQLSFEDLSVHEAAEAAKAAEAAEKATDTMCAAQARAVYGVPSSVPDVFERRRFLIEAMDKITKANKRIGVFSMSSDHPLAPELDGIYGGRRNDGRDRIKANAIKYIEEAEANLRLACGQCAVVDCLLRDNYSGFFGKYRYAGVRKKFKGQLENDPGKPC